MRLRAIALLAVAAAVLAACGKNNDTSSSSTTAPAASADTSTSTSASGSTVTGPYGLMISTDLSSKPEIPKASGKAPTKLVSKDIVVGTGTAAKAGDKLVVHYTGVLFSNGQQFDASWDRGSPFSFALAPGNVIDGWTRGVEGMKVGGRRLLVIPPDLAYGDTGQGSIPPKSTLVFVIDLLNDTPA